VATHVLIGAGSDGRLGSGSDGTLDGIGSDGKLGGDGTELVGTLLPLCGAPDPPGCVWRLRWLGFVPPGTGDVPPLPPELWWPGTPPKWWPCRVGLPVP
jgi:hypothetical protein